MIGSESLGRKGVKLDTAPQILPAGKQGGPKDETAAACFQPLPGDRPTTPPEIKKYRKSTIHEPGVIVHHYGLADDTVPLDRPFGIKIEKNDTAEGVMKTFPASELMQWRLERQEDIYESSKREPLGKSYNRGHVLPEGMGTERPFGTTIGAVAKSLRPEAKELIFPLESVEDLKDSKAHAQYVTTHNAYAPAEQRRRNYDWAASGIDPFDQTFGLVEKDPYMHGVAKALNPLVDENNKDSATIVRKRIEDFKMTNNDELGRVRNLGHDQSTAAPGHVYGVPSRRFEEWGARRLLKGDYPDEEQAPDPDLGKSLRKGYRNMPQAQDKVRSFGVPSIRTDIPGRKVKSVADNNNYGNEPDAASLIYPAGGAERGVVEADYLLPRSKEELAKFYFDAGLAMDKDEFDAIYGAAADVDQLPDGAATINTFQRVRMYSLSQQV